MAFDQPTRNRLARFVADARAALTAEFTSQLQHEYGLDPASGSVAELTSLTQLDDARRETARLLRDTLAHYLASAATPGAKGRQAALERIVREQAFTVLNRLCALRMAEARGLVIESVGRGYQSKGFQLYARLAGTALGETGDAYRCYLFSVFDEFAVDLPVLFDRYSPQGRLFPRETTLLELLGQINHSDVDALWAEDETIGWIYQYFNSKEERKKMRDESQAPRNSRELAVRNQFFTPRYVVEFLSDNTLGRIWYEMTQGQTALVDACRYLVRRPTEIFLTAGEAVPPPSPVAERGDGGEGTPDLSQEELLRQPVYIPQRPLKDPRDLKMLDPACGSMHFGLYAFDLFERIYAEAWEWEAEYGAEAIVRSPGLKSLLETYVDKDALLREVPRLIVERNIHGVDIDPRAVQIAGLSLWLRAQRSWHTAGIKPQDRPVIRRSNVVCAEPMPGEEALLDEFLASLEKDRLATLIRRVLRVPANQEVRATPTMATALTELVRTVWQEMELAGEAGSLLKIEESLSTAIKKGRDEWENKLPLFRVTEFSLTDEQPRTRYLKNLPGETTDFWNRAEALVLAALEEYAAQATSSNTYQRRLFAEDAEQGFAFIDLCRKRYDVVLMNPPFGLAPRPVFEQLKQKYQDTYVDLYASFVTRGIELAPKGLVGAITSRAFLMTKKLARWRANQVVSSIDLVLDLGIGVMDDAFVEAAAYILRASSNAPYIIAVDRRDAQSKSDQNYIPDGNGTYVINRVDIHSLPNEKLLYQLPLSVFALLRDPSTFEPEIGTAREGLRTFDDFRFLRLKWEVLPKMLGVNQQWEPLAKGGEYAKYYSDIHLVVKWNRNGSELSEVNRQVNGQVAQSRQASDYYRREGGTYSKRSVKGFSARALPANCIIGTKGPAVLSESYVSPAYLVGWLNCSLVVGLIHVQANAYEFNTGIIKKLPWRYPSDANDLAQLTYDTIVEIRRAKSQDETNSCFIYPQYTSSLRDMTVHNNALQEQAIQAIENCRVRWDSSMKTVYGVGTFDLETSEEDENVDLDEDEGDTTASTHSLFDSTTGLTSYLLGCSFGRWDIRYVTGERKAPELPDPFEPLPLCPPGMLQNAQDLPAEPSDVPPTYPLRISWPGILVDDDGHSEDIERRVRKTIAVIWNDRADAIEQEAAALLQVRSLREYFRKPAGFFADHLQRYSKSRRAAPIYWPLSTPSSSYTLWLYYHRLTDQTLYLCNNDFVEPKIKQVAAEVARLRQKTGRSAADERELERLTALALELRDFSAELLRVARFWKPNLNDGVQITAAPLWRLFQHKPWQKRLRETWEKLEAGDYDWAHLAYSIWTERVRTKCRTDKSLAIAHDLEELYVESPAAAKKKGGKNKAKPSAAAEDEMFKF